MSKKRFRALSLCVLMVLSLVLFCACENEEVKPTESVDSSELDYKVTVVDGSGAPYTEKIVVKFMQGEEQIAMIPVDADGVAQKVLPKGDYTVDIMSTDPDASYYFDRQAAVLSADSSSLELVLAKEMGQLFETVSVDDASSDAYYVSEGTTHVSVADGDRNYFLFVPERAGTYEFWASDESTIGIYGGSVHFILPNSTHEMVDGKIQLSVQPSMIGSGETGTTVYVICVDVPEGTSDLMLNVFCTGGPGWSFTEEPWTNYVPKAEIQDFVLPEDVTLKKFDLTADSSEYELVLSQTDGYYHLLTEDGPVVYVQLSEPMYGISMMNMVGEIVYQDGVLMQTGTAPFRYSYDNGQDDFFKEDYTDAMRQYVTARDKTTGVYPLNEDLYYMLPLGIESMGWCRKDTVNYLFHDLDGVNDEISWMFLLMHEDAPLSGNVTPTDPTDSTDPTDPDQTVEPTEPTACDHAYKQTSKTDATCTEKGTVGYTCTKCGETRSEQIDATGHRYSDGKCTECGSRDPDFVIEDNKGEPIEIGGTLEFDAEVQAGHLKYYDVYRVSGTYLTISNKDAYVIYNGKTYEAKNGVVTVYGLQSNGMNDPVKLAIGNKGDKDATFKVVMAYPAGTQMNPHKLTLGAITTDVAAGNDQGVFYTFTATSSGVLTFTLESVSNGADAGITLFNETTSQYVTLEDSGNGSVSVDVEAGQTVSIIICTLPDADYNYPAATIKTTATFA